MSTRAYPSKSHRKRKANKTATFSSDSIVPLLSSGATKFSCEYLGEPELVFSDKRHWEDPRTGLTAFGQLDPAPDLVLVAMTEKLEKLCKVGIRQHDIDTNLANEEDDLADVEENTLDSNAIDDGEETQAVMDDYDSSRSFRRGLKAK